LPGATASFGRASLSTDFVLGVMGRRVVGVCPAVH
jgi:hypothetical protein